MEIKFLNKNYNFVLIGLPDTSRAIIVAAIGTMSNFLKVTWEFIDWRKKHFFSYGILEKIFIKLNQIFIFQSGQS